MKQRQRDKQFSSPSPGYVTASTSYSASSMPKSDQDKMDKVLKRMLDTPPKKIRKE